MDRFVVISGCSGGGKSTLLAELRGRGYAVVEEPGRRIVREELEGRGAALPWVDQARRHDVEAATAEYAWLQNAYPSAGYEVITLPKVRVILQYVAYRLEPSADRMRF
jgi:predicted ATPase